MMSAGLISRNLKRCVQQQIRNGYIVLLPEVNTEAAEKNPLFKDGLPEFDKLSREKCVNTFGKIILDFEHSVRRLEDHLLAIRSGEIVVGDESEVFEEVVERTEAAGGSLEPTWALLKTLCYIDHDLMPPHTYLPLNDRARSALAHKYNNHYIYTALKSCELSKLTEEEQRVVNKFLVEGKLNGMELDGEGKQIYREISHKIASNCADFNTKRSLSAGMFKHTVSEFSLVKDFPSGLIASIRVDDSAWELSLKPRVLDAVLERCPSRAVRQNAWLASSYSVTSHPELNNSATLETIRIARKDLAKLLGYRTYADMSMETKLAGSVDHVMDTLDTILEHARPLQEEEMESLYRFAGERGFKGALEPYDIPYWSRQQCLHVNQWSDEETKEFFPLERVMSGLCEVSERLLGVKLTRSQSVQVPHPDVTYYRLSENGHQVAGIYFDPYLREKKSSEVGCSSVCLRPSSKFQEHHPLAYLTCDFPPPSPDTGLPALLTLDQVHQLFTKFGGALQQVLSTVNYSEVSGLSCVEWDAIDIVKNIFSLSLSEPEVLSLVSGHYKTGEKMDPGRVKSVMNHMRGYKLCHQIYLSSVDLQLHHTEGFWLTIAKEEWKRCMVSQFHDMDHSVLNFTDSVIGPFTAAYYSGVWSRMLASDVHTETLARLRSQDSGQPHVGSRFRDTFLAFGGSCHSSEVLRRFLGRDPKPDAFLASLRP